MISNYKPVKEKTEEIFISGKAKWARTVHPDPTYDKWSIAIYPAQAELQKVHDLLNKGIRNKLKRDDDGYHITFSRPLSIKLRNGTLKPLDPPTVIDKDGNPFSEFIGDGSDVSVKLVTYGGPSPGGRGSYYAARLEGIKVNNHIPYVKEQPGEDKPEEKPW